MALNKEIWQSTVVENFFPDNSFAAKSVDDSEFVEFKKVHIPNAGRPSAVKTNRSTKPAEATERTDADVDYTMDELTTDPIYIPDADTVELSYSKRNSVILNDRQALQTEAQLNILQKWAKGASSKIMTTGKERNAHTSSTATGKRLSITKEDVLALMTKFNDDDVPATDRYLLLDAYMYADLISSLTESDKWMFQNSADVAKGVLGNLYGFNVMQRSKVLRISSDANMLPWSSEAQAGELAAGLAWQSQSVSRALGEVKMFESAQDPTYYGDIYSFLVRAGGAARRNDKKGVYLIAESAKA